MCTRRGDAAAGAGAGTVAKSGRTASTPEYREFNDEAADGYAYRGDGAEAEAFFMRTTNVNEIIESMTDEEKALFDKWTRGAFMARGKALWVPFAERTPAIKKATRLIDGVLDRATLTEGIVVTRSGSSLLLGISHPRPVGEPDERVHSLEEITALKGAVIKATGYMSTGAAKQGLAVSPSDVRRKNVEYRFKIPAGSKGAGMWIGDKRINPTWGSRQREFMINRDTKFRVGDARYDAARGVYVVDMEYVGRDEHDYGGRRR